MPRQRPLVYATALLLLGTIPVVAGPQLYSVGFPKAQFNVINGVPGLFRADERGPAGNAVDIKGSSLVHFASGSPLAYPLGGEQLPVVTLGNADGTSTAWDLSGLRGKGGPIRATNGKFKGWYLDWSEQESEVVFRGKTFHARKLILVENPKAPRQFEKYEVSK